MAIQGLQVGRIIHFVQPSNEIHVAGIITSVSDEEKITITLFGVNHTQTGLVAEHDPDGARGTWHWPERV